MPPNRYIRRFADDHPTEALRGVRIPGPSRIRRAFVDRAKWLLDEIDRRVRAQRDTHWLIAELAAIFAAMAELEILWAARGQGGADE